MGSVPQNILTSIEAEIEASSGITGVSSADDSSAPESGNEVMDEEAPSEDELNEADDSRGAAAKGVDDNGSTEAVALEKAEIIDLDDPEQVEKLEIYIEATVGASEMLAEKKAIEEGGPRRGRRNAGDESKSSENFITDLVTNLDDTVDVIDEQEKLGVKSSDLLKDTLENAENAPITNDNMQKVKDAGVEDTTALQSLISVLQIPTKRLHLLTML